MSTPLHRLFACLALAALAAPLSAGLVLDQPKRMDEVDAYDLIAWAAEGEAQTCLDSEPDEPIAAHTAIPICLAGAAKVRERLAGNSDLGTGDRAVIQVLLGDLAAKRTELARMADDYVSERVCAATETAVHELGLVPPGLVPLEMETGAAGSRQELARHLPECRAEFGTPKDGDPVN